MEQERKQKAYYQRKRQQQSRRPIGFGIHRIRDAQQQIDQKSGGAGHREERKHESAGRTSMRFSLSPIEQSKNGKNQRAKGESDEGRQVEQLVSEHDYLLVTDAVRPQ